MNGLPPLLAAGPNDRACPPHQTRHGTDRASRWQTNSELLGTRWCQSSNGRNRPPPATVEFCPGRSRNRVYGTETLPCPHPSIVNLEVIRPPASLAAGDGTYVPPSPPRFSTNSAAPAHDACRRDIMYVFWDRGACRETEPENPARSQHSSNPATACSEPRSRHCTPAWSRRPGPGSRILPSTFGIGPAISVMLRPWSCSRAGGDCIF